MVLRRCQALSLSGGCWIFGEDMKEMVAEWSTTCNRCSFTLLGQVAGLDAGAYRVIEIPPAAARDWVMRILFEHGSAINGVVTAVTQQRDHRGCFIFCL